MEAHSVLSKKRRKKLRLLQAHPYCAYCGAELTLETATLDHVVPKANGGAGKPFNRVLACEKCNNQKATENWTPFFPPLNNLPVIEAASA